MTRQLIVKYIQPENEWERSRWELVEDWQSISGIVVPRGFVTDGASVPRILTPVVLPSGIVFPAAIVHDYVLQYKGIEEANRIFFKELEMMGLSRFKRLCVEVPVNLFWWSVDKYNKGIDLIRRD